MGYMAPFGRTRNFRKGSSAERKQNTIEERERERERERDYVSEDADHFVGDERQEEVDDHVGVLPDADVDTLVRLPTADLAKKKRNKNESKSIFIALSV